jgi:hypothetical protein
MPKRPNYVTARDIVIPAGTKVLRASWQSSKIDLAQAIVGPSKDTHFEWNMPFEDAIDLGLVREEGV